jgi:serine/threonine protein kinase
MNDTPICPECGGGLPAGAPGGLCPRCLMQAGAGRSMINEVQADPAVATLSSEAFKRAIVELGIIDALAVNQTAGGRASDLPELVRSLIQAQVLTTYQACAIQQGKSRGLVVGRYLILDKLGQGGMGVVFKARHRLLDRVVALKILPPSFARRPELVLRFRREMQTGARLNHPNVVAVLDADEDRGIYFLAMEYIEGRDLDHLIRECGPFPIEQALDCAIQAARGLEAAHARGIIHRDIKPANLMLDSSGTVRVLDLGLARLVSDSSPFGQATPHHLTRSGIFMGTVDFMAPEQAEDSHNVDHRADVYSLGCSLYFLLTGRPPFEGATLISRLMAHQDQPPPSIRATRPDSPEALDAAYLAMLAKRADDRPQSMAEVIALLDSCREAAGGAQPRLSLDSFSSTVLEIATPSRARQNPTVFITRDESGGFEFETGPEIEVRGVSDRSDELTRSASATPLSELAGAGVGPRHVWLQRAGLAALGASAALVVFIVIRFSAMRRGGELHSPPAAAVATSIPKAEELIEIVSSGPETTTTPALDAAIVAPRKAPEPSPTEPALDVPARPDITAAGKPKPNVVKVPSFNVAPVFTAHQKAVKSIAVRGDGKVALTTSVDHTARLWEVATGKQIFEFKHPSEVMDAAITPDGRFAVTATKGLRNRNGTLRLWNLVNGKLIFGSMRELHDGPIPAVAFLPGGRGLSGGEDGQVILWNFDLGRPIGPIGRQKGTIHRHAMAVFPHGHRALTGGEDGLVHLWNLAAGRKIEFWKGHDGPVSGIAVSADGRRAATGGDDGTVILWDVAERSEVRRFTLPGKDRAQSVAILPDGNVLAAGRAVGHLLLWDAESGAILRQAKPPFTLHSDLELLPPDGRRFLTADQDGVVRIWRPHE